jgi:outer membrane protein assembly factor BamB
MMLTPAAAQVDLAAAPAVSEVRVLSQAGVRALDAQSAQRWEQPLAGLSEQSRLAVSPDGHSAVSAGPQVYVLSPAGELERTLNLTGNAAGVAWSEDGRLAVVLETGIAVYRADALQYAVRGIAGAEVRFGSDGALAVLGSAGPVRTLALYDYYGTRLMQVEPAGAAHALAFSPDGNVVMAGARAYNRHGRMIWQAVLEPDGVSPLVGTPMMLLWNGRTAQAVNADDGTEVWRAQWNGKDGLRAAEVAPTGGYVAITAPVENGGALWVLDGTGRQLLSEGLPAVPSHLAFAGNRLLFLMNQALQTREISP